MPSSKRSRNPYVIHKNTGSYKHRLMVGTPTMGSVRFEWHLAMLGLVIPCNWQNSYQAPIGFLVPDAQNLIVEQTLKGSWEWLFLLEDDVVPPPDLFLKLTEHMKNKTAPVISGLYHLKGGSKEPLLYRGRGNGAFDSFKPGSKVWVDGIPTGCILIHMSVLRALYAEAEEYKLQVNGAEMKLRQMFIDPRILIWDPVNNLYQKSVGTSDLYFCEQLVKKDIFTKAGWPKFAKKKYPFLCDTSINCGHIDRESGVIW